MGKWGNGEMGKWGNGEMGLGVDLTLMDGLASVEWAS